MKTYGRISFILFVTVQLTFVGFLLYLISNGDLDIWLLILAGLNLLFLVYLVYTSYMVIRVSDHELIIEMPLRKRKVSYFLTDVQAVSIDKLEVQGSGKKQLVLSVFKKDKTQDEYTLPAMFLEKSRLLKHLDQHVDTI